jgi:hypothetical protein
MKRKALAMRPFEDTNPAHFACFACRRSFKQRGSSLRMADAVARPYPCPTCHQDMVRLARNFKAPPLQARRQWLKVELLYRFGERFHAKRTDLGIWCATLPDTVHYLARRTGSRAQVVAVLDAIRRARTAKGP